MKTVNHQELKNAIEATYRLNQTTGRSKTLMVWGPPGVGKSEAVRQVEIDGEVLPVVDIRLSTVTPEDLKGLPVANDDGDVRLRQLGLLPSDDNFKGIILFDEVNTASSTIMAQAYQIFLENTIGEWKKPKDAIIVACGNRAQDNGVTTPIPDPLKNRCTHVVLDKNAKSFIQYAEEKGLDERVIAVIQANQELVHKVPQDTEANPAFPTPRSWETVSDFLKMGLDKKTEGILLHGTVGKEAASLVINASNILMNLESGENILNKGIFTKLEKYLEKATTADQQLIVFLQNRAVSNQATENFRTGENLDATAKNLDKYVELLNSKVARKDLTIAIVRTMINSMGNCTNEESDRMADTICKTSTLMEAYQELQGL